MEKGNNKFFDILTEKIALYENLLESLSGEKEAIKKNSLQDVLEMVRKKEVLVEKLDVNEKKRREIIAYYSEKFNIPQKELTLLKLAGFFEEPVSKKLLNMRNRLKRQLDCVSKSSRWNKELIEACSTSLNKSRNFFEQATCVHHEYTSKGKTNGYRSSQGRVFNSKV